MRKIFIVFLIFSLHLFGSWKKEREALEYVYIKDKFRFFYSLKGKNQLKDKSDSNKNKIPDFIENLAIQLTAADEVLSKKLRFKDPLENKVYKDRVKYIDVHILALKKGFNGLAGDAVIRYDYKVLETIEPSITMVISNKLKLGNLTPLHELFHIYQNGYTMIKNRWYTEGTARWSEHIFKRNHLKNKPLPKSKNELELLLRKTYSASLFWNRLAILCSSDKKFEKTKNKAIKYIGSNKKIYINPDVKGYRFFKEFLENLSKIDTQIEKDRLLKKNAWKEKEQKSEKNNKYILMALLKTLDKKGLCKKDTEKKLLAKEINKFIKKLP